MPGVFVLAPDEVSGVGGIAFQYRFVNYLRELGENAWIMHLTPGHRYADADPRVPVTSIAARPLTPSDIFILPEIYGPRAHEIAPDVPFVILNQNAYYTFDKWDEALHGSRAEGHPYRDPRLLGVICVSDQNVQYLSYAFPHLSPERVWLGVAVPTTIMSLRDRTQSIAYMPRKNEQVARQVFNILKNRDGVRDFRVQRLAGISHSAVIDELKQAQIFLSFASQEGFSLPIIEAMACGALVIGFDGSGGSELLNEATGFPVRFGDVLGFASQVEEVLVAMETEPSRMQELADSGRFAVETRHSLESERLSVQAAWTKIRPISKVEQRTGRNAVVLPFDRRAEEIQGLTRELSDLRQEAGDLREEVVETHARLFEALQQVEDCERQIQFLKDRDVAIEGQRLRLISDLEDLSRRFEELTASTTYKLSRRLVRLLTLNGFFGR